MFAILTSQYHQDHVVIACERWLELNLIPQVSRVYFTSHLLSIVVSHVVYYILATGISPKNSSQSLSYLAGKSKCSVGEIISE